jgi:hypothetical protein
MFLSTEFMVHISFMPYISGLLLMRGYRSKGKQLCLMSVDFVPFMNDDKFHNGF